MAGLWKRLKESVIQHQPDPPRRTDTSGRTVTPQVCGSCDGRKNLVVRISGRQEVVVCPACNGTGEVPVEEGEHG
jgi:DnaJ-class molecular chaperone